MRIVCGQILGGIRELLANHEHVMQEAPRVRFIRFGEDALILEVFASLKTTAYATYLEYTEDVNMQILAIVEAAGTQLALPGREMRAEQGK
jgi:MscS family membrane protein